MPAKKVFKVSDRDFKKPGDTNGTLTWCVEVARKKKGVAVRDSEDPNGPKLFFTNNQWQAFLNGAARGEFIPVGPVAKRLRR